MKILKGMLPVFVDCCYNMYGIHPIQSLLCVNLTTEEESIIRGVLKGKLEKLALVKN